MPRGVKGSGPGKTAANKREASKTDKLLTAIKYCWPAVDDDTGAHLMFVNGFLCGYNRVLLLGHPVDEPLYAAPKATTFRAAIENCDKSSSITLREGGGLTVKSGSFRANVQCDPDPALPPQPDPAAAPAGVDWSGLRAGFEVIERIPNDNATRLITASALVRSNSMFATDGLAIVEFVHGCWLPREFVLPRAFITAVLRVPEPIVNIGVGEQSLTVWFESGAFIKTQTYPEAWPAFEHYLPQDFSGCKPIPPEVWPALTKLRKLAVNDHSYFLLNCVSTVPGDQIEGAAGATMDVQGIEPAANPFNIRRLEPFSGVLTHWDYWTDPKRMTFCGDRLRGVIGAIAV